jgi:hypothetical protein
MSHQIPQQISPTIRSKSAHEAGNNDQVDRLHQSQTL